MAFRRNEDGSISVGMLPEEKPAEVKTEAPAAEEPKPKKKTTKKTK